MRENCKNCQSENLAILGGEKQVCLDCGWRSDNMSLVEAARVILKYYEDECEER